MKNQYFGDVNDYCKYGLLRCLQACGDLRLLVAWMLTLDDGGSDGRKTRYLEEPKRWERFDPELYNGLREALRLPGERGVHHIEGTSLLAEAEYFRELVPDEKQQRHKWGSNLAEAARGFDLVFLDPDNGLEVPSKPLGRSGSSKYVYWHEIEAVWELGASLLIYQHFPRRPREAFVLDLARELGERIRPTSLEAFATRHVVFFLAAQPQHAEQLATAEDAVTAKWTGPISLSGLLAEHD